MIRSKRSRTAVYKAIESGNLTEADLFGVRAVVDNQKLATFIENGLKAAATESNGNKKKGRAR